jgi:hypothetical protein
MEVSIEEEARSEKREARREKREVIDWRYYFSHLASHLSLLNIKNPPYSRCRVAR